MTEDFQKPDTHSTHHNEVSLVKSHQKWQKRFIIPIIISVVVLTLIVTVIILKPYKGRSTSPNQFPSQIRDTILQGNDLNSKQVVFTHPIFDPNLVTNITPLGELMGGYEEAQALAGVMMNLKPEAYANGREIEVYAPTDMKLESYAYFKDPHYGQPSWALIFRISPDITMKFDHITRTTQEIMDATTITPKNNSAEDYPQKKLSFKAGDLIAYTSGTNIAHNWNIYLIDRNHKNNFINQERYTYGVATRLVNARCPFDLYPDEIKNNYLSLMGYSRPGQSSTCGNASHDVSGTLSGMWHLSADPTTGISEQLDGIYASPLSIFKNSAGEVTIDQVDNQRLDIYPDNKTNKDPAEIQDEHCYQLTNGYAYFKVIPDNKIQFSYNNSGNCPTTFPTTRAKTYYR